MASSASNRLARRGGWRLPRRLAQVGGTTSLGDCVTALRYLLDQREMIQGPAIGAYEAAFARQVGARYAHSFASGRVGLFGLLGALGVGAGAEILLQAPTHIVVPNAIRYAGAVPVYVDCRPDTFNIDLDAAERRVTPRTRVLLLQHTFGIPVDLDQALGFARRHDLILIEDCVHALGSIYRGRQVGSFGDAAFFSTEETKMISTTMGGMTVTDRPEIAERMDAFQRGIDWPARSLTARYLAKLVLYHLWTQPNLHLLTREAYELAGRRNPLPRPTTREELRGEMPARYARRLSNAQAAIGLRQLQRLHVNLAHRRAISRFYAKALAVRGLNTPQPPTDADVAYVRFPVWVTDRDAAMRATARAVLGNWFTSVLEEADSPARGGYVDGSCPVAELASRYLVNLPTHPRVTLGDAEAIIAAVAPFARPAGWLAEGGRRPASGPAGQAKRW